MTQTPPIEPPPELSKCPRCEELEERCEQLEECLIKAGGAIRNLRQIDLDQSGELGAMHLAAGTERRGAG